jgi:hypothetical protein
MILDLILYILYLFEILSRGAPEVSGHAGLRMTEKISNNEHRMSNDEVLEILHPDTSGFRMTPRETRG